MVSLLDVGNSLCVAFVAHLVQHHTWAQPWCWSAASLALACQSGERLHMWQLLRSALAEVAQLVRCQMNASGRYGLQLLGSSIGLWWDSVYVTVMSLYAGLLLSQV